MLASLRTQHPSQLEVNPWDVTWFLALNTRVAPFDDVRVRRALNFAVDRERLRDLTVGQGLGRLTCQVLPPDFDGYRRYCPYTAEPSASGAWSAPDLARARQLVRSSGTAGQTVTVWIPSWIHFGAAAGRYVVSVLDSLGLQGALPAPQADPYAGEDSFTLQVGFYGWGPDFAAPAGFIVPALTCGAYNPVSSENENAAEFCDPAIDREIARAQSLQTSDPEAASRLGPRSTATSPTRRRGSPSQTASARGHLDPGRQLPVQPPVGHPARPALGSLNAAQLCRGQNAVPTRPRSDTQQWWRALLDLDPFGLACARRK